MTRLVARKLTIAQAFGLSLIPPAFLSLAAMGLAWTSPEAPGLYHGIHQGCIVSVMLLAMTFIVGELLSFLVLGAEFRVRSALVAGMIPGIGFACVFGVLSPLSQSKGWTWLMAGFFLLIFPACGLWAWRLRHHRTV